MTGRPRRRGDGSRVFYWLTVKAFLVLHDLEVRGRVRAPRGLCPTCGFLLAADESGTVCLTWTVTGWCAGLAGRKEYQR